MGKPLDLVAAIDYRVYKKKGRRPAPPSYQYWLYSGCPFAVMEDDRILWKTDPSHYDLGWTVDEDGKHHNSIVEDALMGAQIVSASHESHLVTVSFDNGICVKYSPFRVPVPERKLFSEYDFDHDNDHKHHLSYSDDWSFLRLDIVDGVVEEEERDERYRLTVNRFTGEVLDDSIERGHNPQSQSKN